MPFSCRGRIKINVSEKFSLWMGHFCTKWIWNWISHAIYHHPTAIPEWWRPWRRTLVTNTLTSGPGPGSTSGSQTKIEISWLTPSLRVRSYPWHSHPVTFRSQAADECWFVSILGLGWGMKEGPVNLPAHQVLQLEHLAINQSRRGVLSGLKRNERHMVVFMLTRHYLMMFSTT